MRKTNPILAGVATVALAATLVPAFAMAAEVTSPDQKTTDVKYEVTQGYEWSVPSTIDFGKDKGVNATSEVVAGADTGAAQKVKVTKNVIAEGKRLSIAIAGSGADGAFEVKTGENTTLKYTVSTGGTPVTEFAPGAEILTVSAGKNSDDRALTFTLHTTDGTAEVAGEYTGTVTYTASIKSQQA